MLIRKEKAKHPMLCYMRSLIVSDKILCSWCGYSWLDLAAVFVGVCVGWKFCSELLSTLYIKWLHNLLISKCRSVSNKASPREIRMETFCGFRGIAQSAPHCDWLMAGSSTFRSLVTSSDLQKEGFKRYWTALSGKSLKLQFKLKCKP